MNLFLISQDEIGQLESERETSQQSQKGGIFNAIRLVYGTRLEFVADCGKMKE
jgi:hypothetical protein